MSAARKGQTPRGARVAYASTAGCDGCIHVKPTALFTLCGHPDSDYRVGNEIQQHTIQHMRDENVGACGDEMLLRKVKT